MMRGRAGGLAVVALSLALAACAGGSSPRAAATSSGTMPVPPASQTGTAQPAVPPASPTAPAATFPPGTSILTRAFSFGAVAWSPDGSAVAAEALGQTMGTGRVDLFAPDGAALASIPGFDFGWLDARRLLVFQTTPNNAASGVVSEWTSSGHLVDRLAGTYGGVLANGHGAALLHRAPPPYAYAGTDFQFWANGRLSPMITAPGMPVAWSPDGRLVAVTESTATVRVTDGVTLASTGGPIMGFLHVLRFPDGAVVRSFRDHPINLQGGVAWSPNSRYVAAGNYGAEGVLVFDLSTGDVWPVQVPASFWRWAPDGRLAITNPDGTTLMWNPKASLTASGLPAGHPIWGPSMDEVAILPEGQPPGLAVMLRTPGTALSVRVDSGGPGFPVAWARDGTSCLLTTASTTMGRADELLRVPLS